MFDVSIVPCEEYTIDQATLALSQAIEAVGGLDWVQPGMKIAVKLNLVSAMKPEAAATVHPVMAAALTRLLTARGATVILGDSPGGLYTSAALNRVYGATGMKLCEEAGATLNRDCGTGQASFPQGKTIQSFTYTTWLDQADAIIDFCKLKTHGMMGMTAATKNMFGVIPGTMKPEYHYLHPDALAFGNMLVDLCEYFRATGKLRLCLCDGVIGMEGNGPSKGTPRTFGAVLASSSPYALDLVCARLLEVSADQVPYMIAALDRGLIPQRAEDLSISGNLAEYLPKTPIIQAGATKSWFVIEDKNTAFEKALKRGLRVLLSSKPMPERSCIGCGVCADLCPAKAITIRNKQATINRKACIRCFCCQEFCPKGAMIAKRPLVARILGK